MFVGDTQFSQRCIRVNVGIDALQQFSGADFHPRCINQSKSASRCIAEKNVLRHTQFIKQNRLLVYGSHTGSGSLVGSFKGLCFTGQAYFTLIRLIDAGKHFNQR